VREGTEDGPFGCGCPWTPQLRRSKPPGRTRGLDRRWWTGGPATTPVVSIRCTISRAAGGRRKSEIDAVVAVLAEDGRWPAHFGRDPLVSPAAGRTPVGEVSPGHDRSNVVVVAYSEFDTPPSSAGHDQGFDVPPLTSADTDGRTSMITRLPASGLGVRFSRGALTRQYLIPGPHGPAGTR
jgi:hypothetical protein